MANFYAVIGSVTKASRIKKELDMRGISSHIAPTPNADSGCSYSLLLSDDDKIDAMRLFNKYRIKRFLKESGDEWL